MSDIGTEFSKKKSKTKIQKYIEAIENSLLEFRISEPVLKDSQWKHIDNITDRLNEVLDIIEKKKSKKKINEEF